MRRYINWLLLLLAVALAALGAAAQLGLVHAPFPALAFGAAAAIFAALLIIRGLPLKVRRPVVFVVALALLAALTGGLAYFQFVIKPVMVKGFITAAFAPKPTTVTAEAARVEQWRPELTAIGTLRAIQGVAIAPQAAGDVTAIHFESGDDVEAGALLINIDDSVEQADLANGLAQLKNADSTLARQRTLVAQGNTPQSTVDTAIATRDSAAATVERTRAVIAQKAIKAPFAGRLGLRNVDLGQYVAVGTSLVTLQRLDPIYADFPVPEEALNSMATGQAVRMTVDAIPGRSFAGKIEAIDARVSAESRNVTARAVFANPDRKLLPGMFANLTVTTGEPAAVLTLPRTAIVYSLYGDDVFVVTPAPHAREQGGLSENGGPSGLIVERRLVRVGPARGERIAIEEGLRAGERVVTAGQIKLQAYSPVTLDETPALPAPAETPRP
ncbi:efflux RND transporter periplasmic adaptor subunit [Roseiarcus sp.]|jgi:membrane fusion protein, multidrug efflux system|uniref:efflux RND transporter periplasmic adaptor subunit n=1 Tax=Roseiarcus sp. TaxID=1969460 RepID=UPI003D0C0C44